jgi:ABC-type antimicrobial peptide transport system permease subunit
MPQTRWLVTALFAVLMLLAPAFVTFTYRALAKDVEDNEVKIEKLTEAVQEIEKHQAVDQAVQEQQTKVLEAILAELRSG